MVLVLWNSKLTYNLNLERGVNILKGNSSTGKTLIYNMAMQVEDGTYGFNSNFASDILVLVRQSSWQDVIKKSVNKFIFVDESIPYIYSKEFADLVVGSNNYFIFSTRRFFKYIDPVIINTATFTTGKTIPVVSAKNRGIDTVKSILYFLE